MGDGRFRNWRINFILSTVKHQKKEQKKKKTEKYPLTGMYKIRKRVERKHYEQYMFHDIQPAVKKETKEWQYKVRW